MSEYSKPLQLLRRGKSNKKEDSMRLVKSDVDFWQMWKGKKLDFDNKEVVFSIEALPKMFCKLNVLAELTGKGLSRIYHRRMVEKMQQLCPNDFQVLPIKLINNAKSSEEFENWDFFGINVLNQLDVLDEANTNIRHWNFKDGTPTTTISKCRYFDDRWDGHLIIRDLKSRDILWHPRLAAEFASYKDIGFYTDEELIAARLS